MPNQLAQYYANLIQTNPNLKRFLDLIGWAEGANYNVGFGNRRINDLSWHPYNRGQFSINDPVSGKSSTTSAAGKYQYQRGTWESVARKLGLSDFSPQSQDIGAVDLIANRGALNDVLTGNVGAAIQKLKPEWQSFVTRPFQTLISKYSVGVTAPSGGGSVGTNVGLFTAPSGFDFNDYLGVPILGEKNRYLLAFAILVIIFIFAFN